MDKSWLIWMSHVTHTNEPRRTCACVMFRMHMSHFPHNHESRRHVSCHTCERVMSHSFGVAVCECSCIQIKESCYTYKCVISHTCMSHVTSTKKTCHMYERAITHMKVPFVTRMQESCYTCDRACHTETCHSCESASYETFHKNHVTRITAVLSLCVNVSFRDTYGTHLNEPRPPLWMGNVSHRVV